MVTGSFKYIFIQVNFPSPPTEVFTELVDVVFAVSPKIEAYICVGFCSNKLP